MGSYSGCNLAFYKRSVQELMHYIMIEENDEKDFPPLLNKADEQGKDNDTAHEQHPKAADDC